MYCRYCGNHLPDDSVFCSACGKKQTAETGAATAPATAATANTAPQNYNEKAKLTPYAIFWLLFLGLGLIFIFATDILPPIIAHFRPAEDTAVTQPEPPKLPESAGSAAPEAPETPPAAPDAEDSFAIQEGDDLLAVYFSALERARLWKSYHMVQDVSASVDFDGGASMHLINNTELDVELDADGSPISIGTTDVKLNNEPYTSAIVYADEEYYYYDYSYPQDTNIKVPLTGAVGNYVEDLAHSDLKPSMIREAFFYRPEENPSLWCIWFSLDPDSATPDVFSSANAVAESFGQLGIGDVRMESISLTVTLSESGELVSTNTEMAYTGAASGMKLSVSNNASIWFSRQNEIHVTLPDEIYNYPEYPAK